MSHKKVISLANRFFIKLAYLGETDKPGDPTKPGVTNSNGGEKSSDDLPELPPHLLEMIQNRPPQEEMLSSPGENALPEERETAQVLYSYAKSISLNLANDFDALRLSGYWNTHPKELQAFNFVLSKFNKLLPMISHSPYTFKIQLIDFLNSSPEIKLYNPINSTQATSQMDNLKIIYSDSYSDMLIRHQNIGLSGGKFMRPIHPKGIRSLMMFNFWMEENM
ncbi:MAG: hypothetical protein WCT07_04180 [Candidatus Paceibacterota bacterium]